MTGRILLVEADGVLGAVLAEVLQHSGYEVIFVKTLQGEVEPIPSVSAVILDIDTTAADQEVAWLDAREHDDGSLPVVLIGVQAPEDRHQLLRAHLSRGLTNAMVWVQKPFQNEELLTAVRQAQESTLPG
ncbi:MAG TPA: hypothetical protein VLA67_03120 [Nitrospiraceae bacterium]|nr:hypothetical protein [Nitrospiraceae bacterium]